MLMKDVGCTHSYATPGSAVQFGKAADLSAA